MGFPSLVHLGSKLRHVWVHEWGCVFGDSTGRQRLVQAELLAARRLLPQLLHGFVAGVGVASAKNGNVPLFDIVGTGVCWVRTYAGAN